MAVEKHSARALVLIPFLEDCAQVEKLFTLAHALDNMAEFIEFGRRPKNEVSLD